MKPRLFTLVLFPLFLLSSLFFNNLSAQTETHNFITYDTTVNVVGGMWNLRITRPANMFTAGNPDTASRPAIIFMVGSGEITNPAYIALYGPHYWLNNGWNGGIQLGNGTHYPIIISVQPYTTGPTSRSTGNILLHILNTYHIKANAVHLTGLSMGAIRWEMILSAEQSPGDETYMKRITSIVALSGTYDLNGQPDWVRGDLPNQDYLISPAWKGAKTFVKKYHGKYLALEGVSDGVQAYLWMGTQAMNDTLPGSAYFSYYPSGHCCWNTMYDPGMTNWNCVAPNPLGSFITTGYAPNTIGSYKIGDNLFKWMLKQGDTTLVGSPAAVNQVPTANAGANQAITLPASAVTLSGSGTDPDGTIASYAWTQVSGTAATIASPSTSSTNITGLSTAGARVFRLTVTDNSGGTGSADVTVTVNAAGGGGGGGNSAQSETNDFITEDTTINFPGVGAWNYRITRPRNMFTPGHPDTASRPAIIFMVGVGEACNCFDRLALNGPHAIYNPSGGGWDGRIVLGNGTHYPIYISVQPHAQWPSTRSSRMLIEFLLNRYHIKRNSVHLTGLSMGAMTWTRMINSEVSPGDQTSMKLVKSIAALQGQGNAYYAWRRDANNSAPLYQLGGDSVVTPELYQDMYTEPLGSPADPHSLAWKAYKIWAKKYGGRYFSLNGTTDYAGVDNWLISEAMNDTLPNTGYFAWENIGGGQHCCWNNMYDPAHTDWTSIGTLGPGIVPSGYTPHVNTMGNYHTGDNIFTWMLKQGDTSLAGSAPANQAPIANAGANQTINLPASSVTLSGSGTDADGTIASYAWTQVSGTAATIASPATASTNITGLATTGIRVFRLTVTDNAGATGTSDVSITVNAAASGAVSVSVTNANPLATTASTASLTSTSSSAAGIASVKWTKFSVPGQTAKTLTVVGSSTAACNGVSGPTGFDSCFVTRFKAYYQALGILGNVTNIALAGTSPFDFNITTVLNYNSDIVLVSFPSNGYTAATNATVLARLQEYKDSTDARGKQFYITGTQPRNDFSPADRANLVVLNDSLRARFGSRFIDFLTPLLNTADNTMKPEYYADGIHPNNAGHRIIYEKLRAANIFQTSISSSSSVTSNTNANTGITGLANGTHKFQVAVVDNAGFAASDVAVVNVNLGNQPPVANAGSNQIVVLPLTIATLSGSGTDPDGTIASYAWTQVSGTAATILTPSISTTLVIGLTSGPKVFRLTVTDNQGATGTADVTVTVNASAPANQAPIANAGTNQTITLPQSNATLSGSGTDADGTIASYAWSQLSGTAATIASPSTSSTNIMGLTTAGARVFRLTVTDNQGATGTSDVTITVNGAAPAPPPPANQSPVANAGANQIITLPTSAVTLSGSGSDPDGTIASYAWSQVSGTAATIASPSTSSTNITGLSTAGARIFRLTVTDNQGATGTSDLTITVNAAAPANQSPVANAGTNQTITLPTSAVTLSGSGSDPDGTIASYAWSQVSGTAATIASPSTSSTNITGLTTAGTRVFRLTVTDNQGATGISDVTITVNAAPPPPNQSPVANAGTAQTITLPTSVVTLSGSGTDPDGTIASYAWSQVSGTAATIASPSTSSTTITGLTTAGVSVFRLTVTDNQGATGASDVFVTVNAAPPPPNQSPVANAGAAQTITLPASAVTLSGSGTDPDGTIASYAWSQVSGTTATIASPSTSSTNITGLTTAGTRVFRLTVTDNQGATGTSDVTITVNPAPPVNQAPVAIAGVDQTITLPASAVTLSGSGTDADGTIVSYAWTQVSGTAATIASPSTSSTNITGLTTAGARVFRLTVTDNQGATGTSDVTITVNAAAPPPNQSPLASAGADQSITLPASTVTLSGSGSDPDGTIASYVWTQISGTSATITNPSTASTTITGLTSVGVRVFRLTVTDNQGATATSDVTITVNAAPPPPNQSPIANAGANQTITLPVSAVTLSGSGTDPDGTIASYAWTQVSGTAAILASPSTASTNITGLTTAGSRVFRLTVTDNQGAMGTSDVTVTVNSAANQSPSSDAGPDQTITLPVSVVSLSGSGTDPDGTIVLYAWTQVSGTAATITSAATAATTITGLTTAGIRVFRLTVTDDMGATAASDITVTVNAAPNQSPTANAGTNQTITLPTSAVTLSGSGSDPDGTIASYAWSQVSGTAAVIASPLTASTNITGLTTAGIRIFRLTVTDDQGATATSDVTITVNAAPPANQPPVANAGVNQTITLPASTVTLSGGGSDPDGTIASYAWTQISGTAATIVSPATAATGVTGLTTAGVRIFRLTVTDNQGATATSDVTITVNAAAPPLNQSPIANAGTNQTITLPTSAVTLSGSGSDPDGTIASYAWSQVSGTAATIASPLTASTNITGLTTAGVRVFRLTVTDNQGATAISDVTITVNAAAPPPNQSPVANAGVNQTITLPTSSVTLSGSGTDPDGTIASYAWTQISGTAATIVSPSAAATNITGLTTTGARVFRLTVTDNLGATATSDVTITVNAAAPPPNQSPVANAGINQTITLPTSSVTLSGSGTDPDGTIASYAWSQVSGTAATITNPSTASTTITGLTTAGVRVYRLTVTDNQGATATSDVTVTVNAAAPPANQSPVVNAGPNQTIILPVSSATLSGSASDPDGSIISYAWTQVSGTAATIVSPASASTAITGLTTTGIRIFRLTVTDNLGATASSNVTITVNSATAAPNQPPVANAGFNINITLPNNVFTLTGIGTDPDGIITSYLWTQLSGPQPAIMGTPAQQQTVVSNLVVGLYYFELKVTDNQGASGKDTVVLTVNAASTPPPVPHAGPDQTITLPIYSVTVTGTVTNDPDRPVVAYLWTKIAGPAQYTIESPTQAHTVIKNLVKGTYLFELKVTDNFGVVGRDTVRIDVKEESASTAKIYPNPATTVINVEINAVTNTNLTDLMVYDSRGVIVYQEQFLRNQQVVVKQINIDRFPRGAYFISVGLDIDNRQTFTFVKQ